MDDAADKIWLLGGGVPVVKYTDPGVKGVNSMVDPEIDSNNYGDWRGVIYESLHGKMFTLS